MKISHEVRLAIQSSKDSLRSLASRYGVSVNTIRKWRQRDTLDDHKTGRPAGSYTSLTPLQELMIVEFRRYSLLPIDDCLYALQASIPNLTRSSLYRCLQRYHVARLPHREKVSKQNFRPLSLGHFRFDVSRIATSDEPLHLIVASDQYSKLMMAGLYESADFLSASMLIQSLLSLLPYRVQSVDILAYQNEFDCRGMASFKRLCAQNGIQANIIGPENELPESGPDHRPGTVINTSPRRILIEQMMEQNRVFLRRYNFRRELKSLGGISPYEFICRCWSGNGDHFGINPRSHAENLENELIVCDPQLRASKP